MSRTPSVWFWKQKGIYCTTINGKRIRLSENKREAQSKLKVLLRQEHKPLDSTSLAVVLDEFLGWCYENRAERTADRYRDFCQDFLTCTGDMPVSSLTPAHVTRWLTTKTTWNATTKNNAITALIRALNYVKRNHGMPNPLQGMEKPTPKRRSSVVTPEDFDLILAHVHDEQFRDLLILSYDSFARPFEIKELEARHIEIDKSRAVIPAAEAKKGILRVFYFPTDRSLEILKRLIEAYPEGPLLRTMRGTKWNGFNVRCRFQRLEEKIGKRFKHYDFRRGGITRAILAGTDSHVVAKLAGHQSTAMIDRHYSVVADDHAFMLDAAKTTVKTPPSVAGE
jgi:integrase/recombinase XerC